MNNTEAGPYPRRRKVIPVQIMLSPQQIADLDAHATRNTESRSDVARRAIRLFLEQSDKKEGSHV